jgi:DNA-binding response OmpR family regulator
MLLLNLQLPRVSGFEVLRWLRRHAHLRPEGVVALSAPDRPQDGAHALTQGADLCLRKPSDRAREIYRPSKPQTDFARVTIL